MCDRLHVQMFWAGKAQQQTWPCGNQPTRLVRVCSGVLCSEQIHSVQFYSVHYSVSSVQCAVWSVQCEVCSVQCSVFSVLFTKCVLVWCHDGSEWCDVHYTKLTLAISSPPTSFSKCLSVEMHCNLTVVTGKCRTGGCNDDKAY